MFSALRAFGSLDLFQISIETTEAFFPEASIRFHPVVDILEWSRLEPARSPLRLAAAHYETRVLENLQVLRDRRKAHVERFREIVHRCLALRQPCEDCSPRGIGQRRKRRAQVIA